MRIENFREESRDDARRVAADVVWEDDSRNPISVYFESDSRFCRDSNGARSAFLLAGAIPALFQGERRIRIEGSLDPVLREGIATALAILQDWYGVVRPPLVIEAASGFEVLWPAPDRAALFLTGGVDSLHMLLRNRRDFPPAHPASFRSAISIAGLAFPGAEDSPRARDVTARQEAAVRRICDREDLEFIAVRTNMRWIEPDVYFTTRSALAANLAATAHFVSGAISGASIASGPRIDLLVRNGSHPLLDPNYTGSALEIRYEGGGYGRPDKVEEVSAWKTALEDIFVCFEGPLPEGARNCGRCEKCVRTMTALLCFDKLRETHAFPLHDVTPEMIDRLDLGYHPDYFPIAWTPIADALAGAGRSNLSRAVRRKVASAKRYPRWIADTGVRGFVRKCDRRLLGGLLASMRRR